MFQLQKENKEQALELRLPKSKLLTFFFQLLRIKLKSVVIAQWLERLACNLRVQGSILGATAVTSANPVVLNYSSCIGGLYAL